MPSKDLHEKTLELNITHELLNLADSFWWYLTSLGLKKYWRPAWKFPFLPYPKSYATGLPISLEGKEGGGYDVCIKSPGIWRGSERAVFMQFKAGVHQDFCENPESIFKGSPTSPMPHVAFEFNNNNKKNQHELLQNLQMQVNAKGHPVLYVFPRITDEQQMVKKLGKLCWYTSFISINDIDAKAKERKVEIKKGKKHYFRSCYEDESKNELNFFFFPYNGPDKTADFMAEIIAIRVQRALDMLKEKENVLPRIYMSSIAQAYYQFIRHLVDYFNLELAVERNSIIARVGQNKVYDILNEEEEQPFIQYDLQQNLYTRNSAIFYNILGSLKPYFDLTRRDYLDEIKKIPEAPSNLTFNLSQDKWLQFESQENIEGFFDFSYQIF